MAYGVPGSTTNNYYAGGPGGCPTAGGGGTAGNGAGGFGSLLPGLIQTGANIYGAQNAGEQMQQGSQAGINQYGPQSTLGNMAFTNLESGLGMNGQPPDLTKMPGY